MNVKLSDRPKCPYKEQELKLYPDLKETINFKKWKLARACMRFRISYLKAFRDLLKPIWK